MGLQLPPFFAQIFRVFGLGEFPLSDEDKLAAFGEGVHRMHQRIAVLSDDIAESVRAANLSSSGPAMTQYTGSMLDVVDTGLPSMRESALLMGEQLRETALQVEYGKGTILINTAVLIPMIFEAIAAAPETLGASLAVAEEAIAALRATVPQLMRVMVEKVATNTAMMEGGDLAVQGYQILIKHDRSTLDGGLSLNTIESGVIAGAMDGLLTGAMMKGAPKFFKSTEVGVQDASRLLWAPPKWAHMGSQAVNNTVTSLIMAGINGEPIDGMMLLEGAGAGLLFGGLGRTGGVKIKPFNAFHMAETFHNGDLWIRPNEAYTADKTGTNAFSFNVRRQPGSGDGTGHVYFGDPEVAYAKDRPAPSQRLRPVIDEFLEGHPQDAPKPRFVVLEHTPAAELDAYRALAKEKGVSIVVPDGRVENGPHGSLRVSTSEGGTGFRIIHPDGTEEHLGQVYDPRQAVGEPIVGGRPPVAKVSLGPGGQKFVSRDVLGEGDCTISALADSALGQGVPKKIIHAENLDLSRPADLVKYRGILADKVAERNTDTRSGTPVLLGELGTDGARDLLGKLGPRTRLPERHLDALDLATPSPRGSREDPIAELTARLEQDPKKVLFALKNHYEATGDQGMAQLVAYAHARVEEGTGLPLHRDLLDYAIRDRTLAETPLAGEMLAAVAHTLGLDVVVVSADKPAFHLNGDSATSVYIHRVANEEGGNHYRALRPEPKLAARLLSRSRRPLPADAVRPARPTQVSPRRARRLPPARRRHTGRRPAPPGRRRPEPAGAAPLAGEPRSGHPAPRRRHAHQRQADPAARALVGRRGPDAAVRARARRRDAGRRRLRGRRRFGRDERPPRPGQAGVPQEPAARRPPAGPYGRVLRRHRPGPPRRASARPPRPVHRLRGTARPADPHPPLLHSIWLGGPLYDDQGPRREFMEVMAENVRTTGLTGVLWTDVPRHEIDQLGSLPPDAVLTPRQARVKEMLDWAGQHRIRLAGVDEVFAGTDRADLHHQIATERARTTGSGYAGASDLLRMDILHRFGGAYTDGDNRASAELTALMAALSHDTEHQHFAISTMNGRTVNNSAFIAPPRNPIVREYREDLRTRYTVPVRRLLAENEVRASPRGSMNPCPCSPPPSSITTARASRSSTAPVPPRGPTTGWQGSSRKRQTAGGSGRSPTTTSSPDPPRAGSRTTAPKTCRRGTRSGPRWRSCTVKPSTARAFCTCPPPPTSSPRPHPGTANGSGTPSCTPCTRPGRLIATRSRTSWCPDGSSWPTSSGTGRSRCRSRTICTTAGCSRPPGSTPRSGTTNRRRPTGPSPVSSGRPESPPSTGNAARTSPASTTC
ncbi:hypothetical protein ACFQ9X_00940 [Catenulispora yoronensis]